MAVQYDAIATTLPQFVPKAIAQHADADHRLHVHGQLAGRTETDGKQGTLRSSTPPLLVPCAMDQRLKRDITADIKRADTLGCVELMASDRQ